jgi:hypothetical protein
MFFSAVLVTTSLESTILVPYIQHKSNHEEPRSSRHVPNQNRRVAAPAGKWISDDLTAPRKT